MTLASAMLSRDRDFTASRVFYQHSAHVIPVFGHRLPDLCVHVHIPEYGPPFGRIEKIRFNHFNDMSQVFKGFKTAFSTCVMTSF